MHAADSSSSSPVQPPHAPRRGLLLVSACTLLAVGIGINVHRHLGEGEMELQRARVSEAARVFASASAATRCSRWARVTRCHHH